MMNTNGDRQLAIHLHGIHISHYPKALRSQRQIEYKSELLWQRENATEGRFAPEQSGVRESVFILSLTRLQLSCDKSLKLEMKAFLWRS